jgi:signal transduction histidine kinase
MLSLAKLNLATANMEQRDMVAQKIQDSHHLISKAIQDLRDLSRSLNSDYVSEMGLLRSIEYELEMIQKTGFMKTALHITGQVYKTDPQKELILFRIVQETLNNVIKHAEADTITVWIAYDLIGITLRVSDNGHGFDISLLSEKDKTKPGLGISSMNNRARIIGADFHITSSMGKGTEVVIQLPKEINNGSARRQ